MNARTSITDLATKIREMVPPNAAEHFEQDDGDDTSALNGDVQELQAALQLGLETMKGGPEIRAERVEALRAQIEADTYVVDSVGLAKKMLGA